MLMERQAGASDWRTADDESSEMFSYVFYVFWNISHRDDEAVSMVND